MKYRHLILLFAATFQMVACGKNNPEPGGGGSDSPQNTPAIILQQDRDWLILTDDSGMVAVTSINGVSIVFEFQLYQDSDWTWARRIVSSVRTN